MMSHLRNWQVRCIKKALRHFETKKHFFCQATPAAGKTRMAAELATRLLRQGKIDLIICFAPMRQIVGGIQQTFEKAIGQPMSGRIGAIGAAFTYPAMDHFDDSFWSIFESHRVFVVFDEIHHCAGNEVETGNAWGAKIVQRIQDKARYTLALSGTPWRSDAKPIVLARYSQPDGRLICDFRYGLREAINQGVCRLPQIVLLDNESIEIRERGSEVESSRCFTGIEALLNNSDLTYEGLLRHEELAISLIKLGVAKLDSLREKNINAGGLIVATNIEHAKDISFLLQNLGESYSIVNNQTPDARNRINDFRNSTCRWIVAVGMVSEGTDIQRLQVCCYLSRTRTELYFRQVLGRVLRRIGQSDDKAWFYALAESKMKEFATRIAEDLPDDYSIVTHATPDQPFFLENFSPAFNAPNVEDGEANSITTDEKPTGLESDELSASKKYTIQFSQNYWHQIISLY